MICRKLLISWLKLFTMTLICLGKHLFLYFIIYLFSIFFYNKSRFSNWIFFSSRRAQMQVLQSNFKQVAQRTMSDISDTSPNTTREHRFVTYWKNLEKYFYRSVVTASEPESELNAAYGDMYTNVTSRKRRVKGKISKKN